MGYMQRNNMQIAFQLQKIVALLTVSSFQGPGPTSSKCVMNYDEPSVGEQQTISDGTDVDQLAAQFICGGKGLISALSFDM
jgi:hypothetical protein